jgi:hypothetical protein
VGINANVNYGFKGEVTSAQTPLILGRGAKYSVDSPNALNVTPGGTGDRSVTVAAGTAWGDGVLSVWSSGAVLNGGAVTSGTRWDTVVIRRTWTPNGTPTGTATLMLLTGSANPTISSNRTQAAGVTTSDQPIALVRFQQGSATAAEVRDLRVWNGSGGVLVGRFAECLQYLTDVGSTVLIGSTLWIRRIGSSGSAEWFSPDLAPVPTVSSTSTGAPESGWVLNPAASVISRYGSVREVTIELRRPGSDVTTTPAGNFETLFVHTIPLIDAPSPYSARGVFEYRQGNVERSGTARLQSDGRLVLMTGQPGSAITARDSGWSVRASFTYVRS